jgi:predicted RND superfamily exporter protein
MHYLGDILLVAIVTYMLALPFILLIDWLRNKNKKSQGRHCEDQTNSSLMNIALTVTLAVVGLCLIAIYGSSLIGFVVLPAFTFMFILIVLATNHSN